MATYFDKKRALAGGIASCGSGFGTFIFAPLVHLLDDNFGWSWTLMMIGVVVLLCIPLGFLFKPIKDNHFNQSNGNETLERTDECGDLGHLSIDCCGCFSVSVTKKIKGYINLLYDAKFLLFLLSNFLTNIGSTVPYAYTVASLKR